MAKGKKRIDVADLVDNGIYYNLEPYEPNEALLALPPQVEIVRAGLLDFEKILSQDNFERLDEETQRLINKRYKSSKIPALASGDIDVYEVAVHELRFRRALRFSKIARYLVNEKETHWGYLVNYEIFRELMRFARRADGRQPSDPKQLRERVKIECEDTWGRGKEALRQTLPPNGRPLTAARPDLYMALPLFEKNFNHRGFHKDDQIQHFTIDRLADVETKCNGRLIPNPMTQLPTKNIEHKHLLCFPSVVIETKHYKVNAKRETECYCQAANGAATALSLLNGLSHFSIPIEDFGEMQPVVAFTFIGYRSRVWIAYITSRELIGGNIRCQYVMQCIWEGDLRRNWDTVLLCRIIENVHYWTVRHFRPWVSDCLGRWDWASKQGDEFLQSALNSHGRMEWKSDEKQNEGTHSDAAGSSEEGDTTQSEDEIETDLDSEEDLDIEEAPDSEDESADGDSLDEDINVKANSTSRQRLRRRVLDQIGELNAKKEDLITVLKDLDVLGEIDEEHEIEDMKNFIRDNKGRRRGSTASGSSYLTPLKRGNVVVAPESSSRHRPSVTHGRTSPLPFRLKPGNHHRRSRSTGEA